MIHLDHYHLLQCFLPLLNFSSSFFCHPSAGSQTPLKPQLLQLLILSLCSVWRRKWQPTPVSLPGKSHRQRSLVGCSPWGYKESGTTERLTLTYLHVSIFPGGSVGKEFACTARDPGSIPRSGRSPGEENGNPFQYSLAWRFP